MLSSRFGHKRLRYVLVSAITLAIVSGSWPRPARTAEQQPSGATNTRPPMHTAANAKQQARENYGQLGVSFVPEPMTMLLLGSGLAGLAGVVRRRRRQMAKSRRCLRPRSWKDSRATRQCGSVAQETKHSVRIVSASAEMTCAQQSLGVAAPAPKDIIHNLGEE